MVRFKLCSLDFTAPSYLVWSYVSQTESASRTLLHHSFVLLMREASIIQLRSGGWESMIESTKWSLLVTYHSMQSRTGKKGVAQKSSSLLQRKLSKGIYVSHDIKSSMPLTFYSLILGYDLTMKIEASTTHPQRAYHLWYSEVKGSIHSKAFENRSPGTVQQRYPVTHRWG